MERLDKIIVSQGKYSRSEVKKLILQGKVCVDGQIVKKSDLKIEKETAQILINNEMLIIKEHLYLILNKPTGYISATEDKKDKTVLDLVPENLYRKDLFPAGRLDKDTTGLMIITDDGELAHNILSPKKHIKKIYEVMLDIPVTEKMVKKFADGIMLNDGECKSACLKITGYFTAIVEITEGRYHQIKRMFGCVRSQSYKVKSNLYGKFVFTERFKISRMQRANK